MTTTTANPYADDRRGRGGNGRRKQRLALAAAARRSSTTSSSSGSSSPRSPQPKPSTKATTRRRHPITARGAGALKGAARKAYILANLANMREDPTWQREGCLEKYPRLEDGRLDVVKLLRDLRGMERRNGREGRVRLVRCETCLEKHCWVRLTD